MDPDMRDVDELLNTPVPGNRKGLTAPEAREEVTGIYNVQFFQGSDVKPVSPLEHLGDARIGLDLFLEEATKALEIPNDELTADQRIHVATIVSFIEALGARFDKIKVPGYVQKGRRAPR